MPHENDSKNATPYMSYATFSNFLSSLKEGVIPARIDKSIRFLAGQSGQTQSYVLSALRFFGLTNAKNEPTSALQELVAASDADWKEKWRPFFEAAYKSILLEFDLERATTAMLHEKFQAQGLTGDTIRKAHSFFASAAEAAGFTLPPALKLKVGGSSGGRKSRKRNGKSEDVAPPVDPLHVESSTRHNTATLLLNADGSRSIRLSAPPTISKSELERIQQWLSFQLIVEEVQSPSATK